MREQDDQHRKTHVCRSLAAGFLAAAAVAAGVTPAAAASARTVPAPIVRLDRSPAAFAHRALPLATRTSIAGNLNTALSVSAKDVWSFGSQGSSNTPLAEHFNGHTWSSVSMPTPAGADSTVLAGATAISASNIWVVGNYHTSAGYSTLSEHWNGHQWKLVTTPNQAGNADNYLYTVSAVSASDVWAVGTSLNPNVGEGINTTLAEHWNGKAWTIMTSPNPNSQFNTFGGVYATSASVLAVGSTENSSGSVTGLSEKWNGTKWTSQPVPSPAGETTLSLGTLAVVSGTDIWSSSVAENSAQTALPLVEHWNGTKWAVAATPAPAGALETVLGQVTADSATDIWAVGLALLSDGDAVAVIEHGNGKAFKLVKSAVPPGSTQNQLTGVAAPSATDAWAVGQTNGGGSLVILTEHWNGTKWSLAQP